MQQAREHVRDAFHKHAERVDAAVGPFSARRCNLQAVVNWLWHRGDAWQMDRNYWSTRRELMNADEMTDT